MSSKINLECVKHIGCQPILINHQVFKFECLPIELIIKIFSYLNEEAIQSLLWVSKSMKKFVQLSVNINEVLFLKVFIRSVIVNNNI